jgi:hypothetical protein
MKLNCDYCKNPIDGCPECMGELTRKIRLCLIVFIVSIIMLTITVNRWLGALEAHERAQRLRKIYLQKNPDAGKALPPYLR